MNDIKTRIDKIFEKYGEYTSFDYSKSRNSGTDEIVEHWNLYTPTIAHNNFSNRAKFVAFLDELINITPEIYQTMEIEEKRRQRDSLKEELEDIEKDISRLIGERHE